MNALATRAREILTRNPERIGFGAIVVFLLLTSLRDMYLWSLFQGVSPLHVAILAFTLSGIFFLPVTLTRHRGDFPLLARSPYQTVLMNAACAVSWIAYFCALKALEPSLAQMLCAGMGPIIADVASWRNGGQTRGSRRELALHIGIVASLLLAIVPLLDSPSAGGGRFLYGVVMALVSGITLAIYRVSCNVLNHRGVAPVTILAVRSPIVAVAAAAVAWSTGDTAVGAWSAGSLALVAANCLVLIVLPIYVNQVGVALASPVTAGVASAFQPTLLYGLQTLWSPGRGDAGANSQSSAISIFVYSCLAVASTVARARETRAARSARESGQAEMVGEADPTRILERIALDEAVDLESGLHGQEGQPHFPRVVEVACRG